jgi:hypothetical protein
VNDHTVRDAYPIPLISDIFDNFGKAKYFTKLDVRWGFNNVWIKEGDEWKAAFITPQGLFEPLVMFFRLCNSPARFQRMMDVHFKKALETGRVRIYMDDIIIFAETKEELEYLTWIVLQLAREANLTFKPQKCEFEREEMEYLGATVREGEVVMDAKKVYKIQDWPAPKCKRELESFLGLANYYRRFIKDFSIITRPMHQLRNKDVKWEWTEAHQAAFNTTKTAMTTAPVLKLPDPTKPFKLTTDASDYATGAILMQEHDRKEHPVSFYSRTMNPAERNYPVHDKEMLAIQQAFKVW